MKHHNGQKFSTKDNDNDYNEKNCATMFKGGWWYNNCHYVNLNGLYLNGSYSGRPNGMEWHTWNGYHYSFMKTKMMMRRIKRNI